MDEIEPVTVDGCGNAIRRGSAVHVWPNLVRVWTVTEIGVPVHDWQGRPVKVVNGSGDDHADWAERLVRIDEDAAERRMTGFW